MMRPYKIFYKKSCIFFERAKQTIEYKEKIGNTWEYKYITYSLISDIWKIWCLFCREVIILSCSGTKTRNGININARRADNTIQRISYEANQARHGRIIRPNKKDIYIRQEPTWGDQYLLMQVIPALSPNNTNSLITGFGLDISAPKHIQIIRNYLAHSNVESANEVKNIAQHYNIMQGSDQMDALSWVEPSTASYAILYWLRDLESIASIVTN
ncbi:hypothetical protein HF923_00485 [Acidithiobacillus ferriphilus]|uniref:hypothetical protein n=1 Tax=Acidithiobacillus ferriphilus TaxID=1689834 RepID=UPI001C070AB3|nr:hypothetical protein [Acidithiobacillus ferriphilus]MBU2844333.1 hypothetical protein [Acidithiobacillus ferriphilus]